MKPIIWLLVFLIITIALSLVFTQHISKLQPELEKQEDDKEGFWFLAIGAMAIIDKALKDKCKNQTNDASNRYSNRNATSAQRNSACNGGYLVNKYSEELVKRWDQSKQTAVERAFKNNGVTFITDFNSETTQRDINFLLIFFKEVHGIDLLTYPYDGNMNKFKELVQNMKTANATSFQDYLAQSIAVNEQPLPPHLMGEVKPPHLMVKSEGFSGNITNIGCYKDNDKRAVPNYVANVPYNEDGINQCADKAAEVGSSVFGLQYRNGNNAQCFIGNGSPNEIENAKQYGKSSQDCTKNAVPMQNNLFVLPPKPKVFSDMDIFKEFASNKELQKKFKDINPSNFTQVLNRKADLSKAMQPPRLDGFTTGSQLKEGIDTVPMSGYTGYPNTERGMATTWNTFYKSSNVNDGPEANCKKICDKNTNCKAFVVQKREPGPWDCWTIPASNLNAATNPAKPNAAQATYVKQPKNIKCASDAICNNPEGFTSESSTSAIETLTNNYTLVANKDFPGNDLANMPIRNTTADACKAKCDTTAGCKGFVFDKRNNVNNCWLKSVPIPAERLASLNSVDTYIQQTAGSSSSSEWLAKSNATVPQISAASQNVPKNVGQNANFAEFNNNVSKLSGLKINTNAAAVIQILKANGINISNTPQNQVRTVIDGAIGMGVKTEIQLADLLQKIQMQNKANCIRILNLMGVRYYEPGMAADQNELGKVMINIFMPFQISSYEQLNNYYTSASNGRLREIGVRPDLTTLRAMVNFKYTYGGVMESNFVDNMKAFGFNSNSDFAGILNSMFAFGINTKNLADFKSKTGMTNINEMPDYVTTMKSFGIKTNNSDHMKILGVAQQYKVDGDTIPSPTHTKKTLQLLKDAEIMNITNYNDFRKFMGEKFANYDDAAFIESLTKFGTFKNRGSDNKGRLRRTEIEKVVNSLHQIKPFKSSNNVSFRELIDSMTSQKLRLHVAGDQTKKFMKFDQDAARFLGTFSGASQKNFGTDTKQGFTDEIKEGFSSFLNMFSSSPEPFENVYDINRNLGISNPVQAVKHAPSPGGYMSEPDFYSLVRSFNVKTVSDYDDFVRVFKLFESNNENIMEVIGVLNTFGVPKDQYKKFVEKLTKIGVTYPYFKYFMTTIMDFGVKYSNFDRFMGHLNAFGIQFTTPVKVNGKDDNTFYRFLSFMRTYGMAIQYKSGEYNKICKNKVQHNDAFFNAINNMILYGYTINTFFPGEQGVVSASNMIQYIYKYDCQLSDFTRIDKKFFEKMRGRTNNKKSVFEMIGGVEEKDKYLKYFSNIFIGNVKNSLAFTPNAVYSFMTDEEFNRQTGHENTARTFYGGDYFRNLAVKYTDVSGSGIIENHLNAYLDGDKVRESEKEKYISYSLLMNTLRLFPNFIAGFMEDTMKNKQNIYNAQYNSKNMNENPFLQRGNTRYIHAQTNVNKAVGQRPQT